MRVRNMVVLAMVVAGVPVSSPLPRARPARMWSHHPVRAGVRGSGSSGDFAERTVDHETDDVIDIPIKDVVRWQGRSGEPSSTTPPTAARSTAVSTSSCRSASPA